jgi:uncharacterized protein
MDCWPRTRIVALLCTMVAAFLGAWWGLRHAQSAPPTTEPRLAHTEVTIAGERLHVEVATTSEALERGLGGRARLAPDAGMLFVFPEDGRYSFWMKDMHFPIDMLWIAADHSIVFMVEHASPDSYPKTFTPESPARYVLEVASGYIQAHHVKKGDTVGFSIAD